MPAQVTELQENSSIIQQRDWQESGAAGGTGQVNGQRSIGYEFGQSNTNGSNFTDQQQFGQRWQGSVSQRQAGGNQSRIATGITNQNFNQNNGNVDLQTLQRELEYLRSLQANNQATDVTLQNTNELDGQIFAQQAQARNLAVSSNIGIQRPEFEVSVSPSLNTGLDPFISESSNTRGFDQNHEINRDIKLLQNQVSELNTLIRTMTQIMQREFAEIYQSNLQTGSVGITANQNDFEIDSAIPKSDGMPALEQTLLGKIGHRETIGNLNSGNSSSEVKSQSETISELLSKLQNLEHEEATTGQVAKATEPEANTNTDEFISLSDYINKVLKEEGQTAN